MHFEYLYTCIYIINSATLDISLRNIQDLQYIYVREIIFNL